MHRFIAHWVTQMDDMGNCEYGNSIHSTLEEARLAAIAESKKAGIIEWVQVREQELKTGKFPEWATVAKWTGDWDQIEQLA